MLLSLLLPAVAIVVSLLLMSRSLRSLETELSALRRSLRRVGATAVATDELAHSISHVQARAAGQAASARLRLSRRAQPASRQRDSHR